MKPFLTWCLLLIFLAGRADPIKDTIVSNLKINSVSAPELPARDLAETLFSANDGSVWIAFSHNGLFRFNGYEFLQIKPESFGLEKSDLDRIISMEQLQDGQLCIGARDRGVCLLDFKKYTAKRIIPEDEEIKVAMQRVWGFYPDPAGRLWMATWRGLVVAESGLDSFALFRFPFKTRRNDATDPSIFRKILPDPVDSNKLWIGGMSGLFSFDKTTMQFTRHRHPDHMYLDGHPDFTQEHLQYLINDLYYQNGALFMATWGGGILRFEPASGKWSRMLTHPYRTDRTLDENIVNRIIPSNDNTFFFTGVPVSGWFSAAQPLPWMLPPAQAELPINSYAVCRDRINTVWISTYQNGLFRIPGKASSAVIPQPYLEFYRIESDQSVRWDAADDPLPPSISQLPDVDTVTFNFALINPLDPVTLEYQYQLTGQTSTWVANGNENVLVFDRLPAGNHILRIRAREGPGDWVYSEPFTLERQVYFYRRGWFWLSVIGLGLAIVAFVIRRQIRLRIARERSNRQMIELRMQALQTQMNPHFIFNSLNSIQHLILQENAERAADQLNLFSKLVRDMLKNSEKRLVSLREDLATTKKYLEIEEHRFSGKFSWKLDPKPAIDLDSCFIPPLLIQPYLENAIWHGLMPLEKDGNLLVRYSLENQYLAIVIEDNGVGMKNSRRPVKGKENNNGMGMRITASRIEMLGKWVGIEPTIRMEEIFPERANTGTRVIVRLPKIDMEMAEKMVKTE